MKRTWIALAVALGSAVLSVRADAGTGLVLQDQTALRAAPKEAAPLLTPLWRGEALELRGQRGDWLQVWDPQRQRGGYVRQAAVMPLGEGDASVPELAAQLRLVRQQPGAEALGLGLAAALVERASPAWLAGPGGAELLEGLVTLQDRLAARANSPGLSSSQQAAASAHTEVAARYGHPLRSLARADGSQWLCPAEEPARLLRGHPAASSAQQVLAALQLTRPDCIAADTPAIELPALHIRRAQWLDGIALQALTPQQRNRLLLRRAGVQASVAFARRTSPEARGAATEALAAWTQLIPAELTEDDAPALREAAIRIAPMRWLARPGAHTLPAMGGMSLSLQAGGPGESCLVGLDRDGKTERLRRCSHGLIHTASARLSPGGRAMLVAVQPLDGWTELWRIAQDGSVQVLPPSAEVPGLGVAELAGFQGGQILVAREAEAGGKLLRRFEVYGPELDGTPQRWSGEAGLLGAFQRGADAAWKAGSPLAR
ncbi:hypothetical protein [Roseateles paludis]|uniref:SH3 domain-containing protein n=1 Tax=Roseateles paludis TaxID=3145238 RepID=A0ABV0FXP2_9BURK